MSAAVHLRTGESTACGLFIDGDIESTTDVERDVTCDLCRRGDDVTIPQPPTEAVCASPS